MSLIVVCDHCGVQCEGDEQLSGKEVKCPTCGKPFIAHVQNLADAPSPQAEQTTSPGQAPPEERNGNAKGRAKSFLNADRPLLGAIVAGCIILFVAWPFLRRFRSEPVFPEPSVTAKSVVSVPAALLEPLQPARAPQGLHKHGSTEDGFTGYFPAEPEVATYRLSGTTVHAYSVVIEEEAAYNIFVGYLGEQVPTRSAISSVLEQCLAGRVLGWGDKVDSLWSQQTLLKGYPVLEYECTATDAGGDTFLYKGTILIHGDCSYSITVACPPGAKSVAYLKHAAMVESFRLSPPEDGLDHDPAATRGSGRVRGMADILAAPVESLEPLRPERTADWQTVSIPGLCTYQIPPTVEIQAGAYKRVNDELQRRLLEISISPDRVVAQPKGINEFDRVALDRYCRIIVSTERGSPGDYLTLDEPLGLSRAELKELDDEGRNQLQQAAIATPRGMKMVVLSWQPMKIVRVDGVDALMTTFSRSMNDAPPVLVRSYMVQNNDVMHTITVSYRESERELWADDLDAVITTFRFEKR